MLVVVARVELRTLKVVSVAGFGFPHAAQVVQVTRKVRDLQTRRWRTVTIYAITSLTHAQASPARLADYIRGHWGIENGLHYVRDVTFAEDTSQVRTGASPHVMACLRNLVIGALSRAGPVNLAAAYASTPTTPLGPSQLSGSPTDENRTFRENAGALPGSGASVHPSRRNSGRYASRKGRLEEGDQFLGDGFGFEQWGKVTDARQLSDVRVDDVLGHVAFHVGEEGAE
jgi:predicted transposase YbfD/YdcC